MIAWLLLFAVAFTNGALRAVGYQKYLGEWRANQVSCGIGIIAIWVVVWALGKRGLGGCGWA